MIFFIPDLSIPNPENLIVQDKIWKSGGSLLAEESSAPPTHPINEPPPALTVDGPPDESFANVKPSDLPHGPNDWNDLMPQVWPTNDGPPEMLGPNSAYNPYLNPPEYFDERTINEHDERAMKKDELVQLVKQKLVQTGEMSEQDDLKLASKFNPITGYQEWKFIAMPASHAFF